MVDAHVFSDRLSSLAKKVRSIKLLDMSSYWTAVRIGIYFLIVATSPNAFAAKVALYSDSGVWGPSLRHSEMLLREMKVQTERLSAKDILNGRLRLGDFKAILIPGGKSWLYRADLGEQGANEIREFVGSGGGYVGFCAGAFMAVSNREGGNTTGPYGMGLLEGTAIDPEALRYPGYKKGMKTILFNLAEFKEKYKVIYLAGPIFKYSAEEAAKKSVRVVARYKDSQVAAIHFEYGKGRVFVSGPHPEVEERLNLLLRFTRPDPDSEWPIVKRMFEYVLGGSEPELRN